MPLRRPREFVEHYLTITVGQCLTCACLPWGRRDLQGHSMSARGGHRLTFTRHLSSILVPMIKTKPPRCQTLIERPITVGAFGTEKYYVIDSRTNTRIVKCRN